MAKNKDGQRFDLPNILLLIMIVIGLVVGLTIQNRRQISYQETASLLVVDEELRDNDRLVGIYDGALPSTESANLRTTLAIFHDPNNLNEGEFLKIENDDQDSETLPVNAFGRWTIINEATVSALPVLALTNDNYKIFYLEMVDEDNLRLLNENADDSYYLVRRQTR
ncbi:MAG: hypothetical protein LBG64_02015 [Pseudomonadales bacterium]|jgi:hypothetical protein|nr:hypothetical protein [Pseudomonadales bacterium]